VFSRINQDPGFSSQRSLLSQGGSQVLFGELLVIPIESSFLYVLPVYVRSNQPSAIPEVKRVVVVNGSAGQVSVGDSLADALDLAVSEEPGEEPGGPGEQPPTGSVDEQVAALLASAAEHYRLAEEALDAGDLGTYQEQTDLARQDVERAAELLAGELTTPTGGPTSTPTPTPTPSPSP
jgi:uncharacterized membrane protein (UPF0182 family)